MNFRTTAVLLLLVVIGGAVYLFAPEETPDSGDAAPTGAPTTRTNVLDPPPDSDSIVRAQLERPGADRLVFERSPNADDPAQFDDWRMLEPLPSDTETWVVTGLVSRIASLQSDASFSAGADGQLSAAAAGLAPPQAKFTIVDKDGKEFALEIGKQAALSNNTYVRVAGSDTVHLVGFDLKREYEKDVNDYRRKTLCRFQSNDAVRVEIQHGDQRYELTRGDDKNWVINAPVKTYAQNDKIAALVGKLAGLRVEEFVEDAPQSLTAFGLDQPFLTMTVTTQTKRTLPPEQNEASTQPAEPKFETVTNTFGLQIGWYADTKQERRYVKLLDQPWIASVKQTDIDALVPALGQWRDPRVTRVTATDITAVELTVAGQTASLTKQGVVWSGTGDLAQADQAAVNALAEAFEDARALDYVDQPGAPSEYGLDNPRAELKVTTRGAVEPLTLRIGSNTPSGRNTYVQVAGQASVLVISAKQADALIATPLSLRSRAIFSENVADMRRIELTRGSQRFVLERQDGQWRMTEPDGAPPDPASLRELENDLSRLRAKQVVGKDDFAAYGLAPPLLTVKFAVQKPTEGPPATTQDSQPAAPLDLVEHTLEVGRKGVTPYCRKDGGSYIFELDPTVFEVLTQELIDRKLFDFKADEVVGLKIEAPGGTLEFAKRDDQWTYPPDPTVQLAQKKVSDRVQEIVGARVEAYLTYRNGDLAAHGLDNAPVTVTILLSGDRQATLKVDQVRPGELPRKAAWLEQQRIFLLRHSDAERLMNGLDHYLTSAAPEPNAP